MPTAVPLAFSGAELERLLGFYGRVERGYFGSALSRSTSVIAGTGGMGSSVVVLSLGSSFFSVFLSFLLDPPLVLPPSAY